MFRHVLNASGAFAEALATVDLFLKDYPEHVIVRPNGLQLRGALRLKLGQTERAESDFRDALELARRIGSRPIELRSATSLAQLWQTQGKRDEARALLAPSYAWFTDGFDTRDLIEAKAVLQALAAEGKDCERMRHDSR
ncbi:MAG: tetratricopeptide repeat protein [Micropepsaceae bacterium]